ncbi:MAG: extensin family protein [Rhodospirillales bacterium]|nr:extensin family protein [Rhodospirillales bacterium]
MRFILFITGIVLLGIAAIIVVDRLLPQDSPFGLIDLDGVVGRATAFKLARLRSNSAACYAALARASVRVVPLAEHSEGAFCDWHDAVRVRWPEVRFSAPVKVTCPLAAALTLWQRAIVQPAAVRYLKTRVRQIDHIGTYACRRVYGGKTGRASEHATANAIDVTGFRLATGRSISVLNDWDSPDPAKAAFLRKVHDGACRIFRGVLGPDYNAAHHGHFHLDFGPYAFCR